VDIFICLFFGYLPGFLNPGVTVKLIYFIFLSPFHQILATPLVVGGDIGRENLLLLPSLS